MPKPVLGRQRRTNPFIWCFAIICAVFAVAVIITGLVVFIGYLVIRPKVPVISVTSAHLDRLLYDEAGILTVQITIIIRAKNDNTKAHASFYNTNFILGFDGLDIANLVADPFDVPRNNSIDLHYQVESSPIPLGLQEQEFISASLRQNRIRFDLKGTTRTRWRIGMIGSVKFWLHLDCNLRFFVSNYTSTAIHCTSKSK